MIRSRGLWFTTGHVRTFHEKRRVQFKWRQFLVTDSQLQIPFTCFYLWFGTTALVRCQGSGKLSSSSFICSEFRYRFFIPIFYHVMQLSLGANHLCAIAPEWKEILLLQKSSPNLNRLIRWSVLSQLQMNRPTVHTLEYHSIMFISLVSAAFHRKWITVINRCVT